MNVVSRRVQALALLALAGLALAALAGRADDKKDGKLPPAKELLAKYVQAIGGKEALLKQEYSHAKGKIEVAGLTGDLDIYQARPDKMLLVVKIEGFGEIRRGYDGKTAWSIDPNMGPQILEGKMAEDVAERARLHGEVDEEQRFKSMETVGEEKFNGKDCYKVKLVRKSGKEETRFYNKATGLQEGVIATQETPGGPLELKTMVNEYKKFGDILQPAKTTTEMALGQQVITVSDVTHEKLEPKLFELPPQVKALLK